MGKITTSTQENQLEESEFSWQRFQEFYHNIVGEKEHLRKYFSSALQIDFSDLEDLNAKILQAADAYGAIANNHNYNITYIDKNSLCTPSFDQFKIRSNAGTSATKKIEFEYNFYIKHSKTGEEFNYKIRVGIASQIAIYPEIKEDFPVFLRGYAFKSGFCRIDFVDYSIAQNFINIISTWFEERKKDNKNKIVKKLQKNSYYLPSILQLSLPLITLFAAANISEQYIGNDGKVSETYYILISALAAILSSGVGFTLGKLVENSIDNFLPLSYLNINDGDKRLIAEIKKGNEKALIHTLVKASISLITLILPIIIEKFLL